MGFFKKVGRAARRFARLTGDPGGTIIHKLSSGTFDRGANNTRAAIAPWEPNTPPPEPPPTVPLPDEEDLRRARRRSARGQLRRAGRSSTILSGDESDYLGP